MLLQLEAPPSRSRPELPENLRRHLSACLASDPGTMSHYVDRGAELVTPDAIAALRRLRRPLLEKIRDLHESTHLQRRLELLFIYFEEACTDGSACTPSHRDAAFALLYFLQGLDRVPDSVPEVGLLDDAMVVQVVIQRNATLLRAHWLRRLRAWPSDL